MFERGYPLVSNRNDGSDWTDILPYRLSGERGFLFVTSCNPQIVNFFKYAFFQLEIINIGKTI